MLIFTPTASAIVMIKTLDIGEAYLSIIGFGLASVFVISYFITALGNPGY